MDSLRSAPKEYAESLKIQSEAINAPRIGTDDNFAYPTMQLNNAAGEKEEDGACRPTVHPCTLMIVVQSVIIARPLANLERNIAMVSMVQADILA